MDPSVLTTLKILITGESGVGKSRYMQRFFLRVFIGDNNFPFFLFPCTSLLLRFTDDTFDNEQAATIGVDFKVKLINIDGNNVKLAIWVF